MPTSVKKKNREKNKILREIPPKLHDFIVSIERVPFNALVVHWYCPVCSTAIGTYVEEGSSIIDCMGMDPEDLCGGLGVVSHTHSIQKEIEQISEIEALRRSFSASAVVYDVTQLLQMFRDDPVATEDSNATDWWC